MPISELAELVSDLSIGHIKWDKAVEKYGLFESKEMTEEEIAQKVAEKPVKKDVAAVKKQEKKAAA